MEYKINGITLNYNAQGNRSRGNDQVLLDDAVDLTAGRTWQERGFTIEDLYDAETFTSFQGETYKLLIECWKKSGIVVPEGFALDQYHTLIKDFKQHLEGIEHTKLLSVERFPLSIARIEDRISEICGQKLKARNPFDDQAVFHFRVIRPNHGDNNPLHRDVWLEEYYDCINLYIPITGSNERSSLILLPGSHRWSESKIEKTDSGAEINGIRFNVPAVTAIDDPFEVTRPDPRENQVLVFSPYLIHGGSVNLNTSTTRISIELRLWKK